MGKVRGRCNAAADAAALLVQRKWRSLLALSIAVVLVTWIPKGVEGKGRLDAKVTESMKQFLRHKLKEGTDVNVDELAEEEKKLFDNAVKKERKAKKAIRGGITGMVLSPFVSAALGKRGQGSFNKLCAVAFLLATFGTSLAFVIRGGNLRDKATQDISQMAEMIEKRREEAKASEEDRQQQQQHDDGVEAAGGNDEEAKATTRDGDEEDAAERHQKEEMALQPNGDEVVADLLSGTTL